MLEHYAVRRDLRQHRQVVGYEDQRHPVLVDEGVQQRQDLGLDRHVERRRRLIGDQQPRPAGECHRDRDTLQLAARELVRVSGQELLGIGQPDAVGLAQRPLPRVVLRGTLVDADRLRDLPSDRADGVERGAGLLEDDPDVVAAEPRELAIRHSDQLAAVPDDTAGCFGPVGKEPQDRERGQGLARTGLTDESEPRAVRDLERDAVDHVLVVDADHEVAHDQGHETTSGVCVRARRADPPECRSVGSVASRMASPSRLSASTVPVMTSPGHSTESG